MNGQSDKRILINKLLAGEISANEIGSLKDWLASDRENRRIFDEENELWQESRIKVQNEHFIADKAWSEISLKLDLGKRNVPPVLVMKRNSFRVIIAAASIICIFGLGFIIWLSQKKPEQEIPVASTIIRTHEGEKSQVMLNDSTIVYMNSASILEYPNDYNIKERRVKLTGEAFFDVHTDPEKPFTVQLDKLTVTASGTRFNVLAYCNDNQIETTLEEGNIEINISGEEHVDLEAGQQIVYYRKSEKLLLRNVDIESYTSWKENKLRFNDTPFEEVLRKISRRYNVIFEVRNRDLLELRFTATFIDESIEDVMNMLETVSPIKYRIIKRTTINDRDYLKPKIIVGKKWNFSDQKKYLQP